MRLFLSTLILITGLCTHVWAYDSTFQRSTPFVALSTDSDALGVSEANNVLVDTSGGAVTLGGLSGGSIGQTVQIVNTDGDVVVVPGDRIYLTAASSGNNAITNSYGSLRLHRL